MTPIPPPNGIQAIVSDFIGVLTTPLTGVFTQFQEEAGIPPEALRVALDRATKRTGTNPLFELECGRMTEAEFLHTLEDELEEELGRPVSMRAFTDHYWATLTHNEGLVAFLRDARAAGYRLALLTNNVQEWEPRWRPKWPIDELFETVVDSGFVGLRKPDPAIYALTLRAPRPARRGVRVHRRPRAQHRRGARVRPARRALPRHRADDRRGPDGPGDRVTTSCCTATPSARPALRHEVPLAIIDPFPTSRRDGGASILTNALERERIAAVAPGRRARRTTSSASRPRRGRHAARRGRARGRLARWRRAGRARRAVPPDLPVAVADRLRADGVELIVDPTPSRRAAASKSQAELAGIRRAQRAAEAGMAAAAELLRAAEPSAGGWSSTARC